MLELWQQKARTEGHDMEECIVNTIYAAEVCRRTKENILKGENNAMRGVMRRPLEDMVLIKGKLKIGRADKIAELERAEVNRVSEVEERKRRFEDRAKTDCKARTQRE